MTINKRNLHTARRGKLLAAWLNRESGPEASPVSRLIGFWVWAEQQARKRRVAQRQAIQEAFAAGLLGGPLPEEQQKRQPRTEEEYRQRAAQGSCWPIHMRVEFRPKGNQIEVKFVPEDQDEASKMLYHFIELINSGNTGRLRICGNCEKYWWCARKANARFCSAVCRVNYWRKTPQGRKSKGESQRRWRANARKAAKRPIKITKEMLRKQAAARNEATKERHERHAI